MEALRRLAERRAGPLKRAVDRFGGTGGLVMQPVDALAGPRVRVEGRWLLSFVSTNYLGLAAHPRVGRAIAGAASRWGASLSTPRLLASDPLTPALESAIAGLSGHPAALLLPSTTHAALDVLPLLAGRRGALFVDDWAYPISLQGAHLALAGKARLHLFPHDDHRALDHMLALHHELPDKVIVCDGVYVESGAPAPLGAFAELARRHRAVVYVDDAHGIGILGAGGAGTPAHLGIASADLVHVGTLSKAFGVPVAFVAGGKQFIDLLRVEGSSVAHSSPAAIPLVAAGLAALELNTAYGDRLRQRLDDRVRSFRHGLERSGLTPASAGLFPIQSLLFPSRTAAVSAALALRRRGVWALLQLGTRQPPGAAALRFAITALHSEEDIEEAVAAIARVHREVAGKVSPPAAIPLLTDPRKGVLTAP